MLRAALAAICTCSYVATAFAVGAARQAPLFRTGVDVFTVTAAVTDGRGRLINDLAREDFALHIDGQPEAIIDFSTAPVPVGIAVLVDAGPQMESGGLVGRARNIAKDLNKLIGTDDRLLVAQFFSNGVEVLQDWTADRKLLDRAVDRIGKNIPAVRPGKNVRGNDFCTRRNEAVLKASEQIAKAPTEHRAILVISNGKCDNSRLDSSVLVQVLRATDVAAYAFGVSESIASEPFCPPDRVCTFNGPQGMPTFADCAPQGPGVPCYKDGASRIATSYDPVPLRMITDKTGGRTEAVHDAKQPLARLLGELGKQYVLKYAHARTHETRWREIRVETPGKPYFVLSRTGHAVRPSATASP